MPHQGGPSGTSEHHGGHSGQRVVEPRFVDLMGRLSNPSGALEIAIEQGCAHTKCRPQTPKRSSEGRRAAVSNNPGRLSNPSHCESYQNDQTSSEQSSSQNVTLPSRSVQRRLSPAEVNDVIDLYHSGHSLTEIAQAVDSHRQTVSSHLKRLGIRRRVSEAKLSPSDVAVPRGHRSNGIGIGQRDGTKDRFGEFSAMDPSSPFPETERRCRLGVDHRGVPGRVPHETHVNGG